MVTVWREGGLRCVIYTDDHEPPHVHVFGDGETKIALDGPNVLRIVGATKAESRRALRLVRNQKELLLERWNELHG